MKSDADIRQEVEEALAESKSNRVRRREMKSGQIKKTLWGDMIIKLTVDLPADMPEENFKKAMAEYGDILREAFNAK